MERRSCPQTSHPRCDEVMPLGYHHTVGWVEGEAGSVPTVKKLLMAVCVPVKNLRELSASSRGGLLG